MLEDEEFLKLLMALWTAEGLLLKILFNFSSLFMESSDCYFLIDKSYDFFNFRYSKFAREMTEVSACEATSLAKVLCLVSISFWRKMMVG